MLGQNERVNDLTSLPGCILSTILIRTSDVGGNQQSWFQLNSHNKHPLIERMTVILPATADLRYLIKIDWAIPTFKTGETYSACLLSHWNCISLRSPFSCQCRIEEPTICMNRSSTCHWASLSPNQMHYELALLTPIELACMYVFLTPGMLVDCVSGYCMAFCSFCVVVQKIIFTNSCATVECFFGSYLTMASCRSWTPLLYHLLEHFCFHPFALSNQMRRLKLCSKCHVWF